MRKRLLDGDFWLFQEKKFEQEKTLLLRTYEAELDNLARQQRQAVEKAETQQDADLRLASKKIRAEQVSHSPRKSRTAPIPIGFI